MQARWLVILLQARKEGQVSINEKTAAGVQDLPSDLYLKEYSCPVSELKFQAVMVKTRAYSLERRDPDFRPHYIGINPLHYSIIISPVGFAAEESQYKRSPKMLFRDFEGLARRLRSTPREELGGLRSVQQAARSCELALAGCEFLRIPQYEVAGLALRASWLNLEWAETEDSPLARTRAAALRRIALEKYMHAFQKEDVSKLRLGSHGVAMIVAELLREQGRYDEALQWFMRLVTDRSLSGEILRNARNQMELCREQRKGQLERTDSEAVKATRTQERVNLALYQDQRDWLAARLKGSALNEAAVLRSLLDAMQDSGRDPAEFATEEDLRHWLAGKLQA